MVQENDVIHRVLDGNINDYEELVNRYIVGLTIHCERLVGERATAEDIAQEAFIKAFGELRKFDPDKGRFSTWLYRIATNKAYDQLRKQQRTLPTEDVDELADVAAPDFENEQQKQMVREAVGKLMPPEHRKVIEAYYWQGKSYQEISVAMDIPINTVRTRLHRAKQQLRKELI